MLSFLFSFFPLPFLSSLLFSEIFSGTDISKKIIPIMVLTKAFSCGWEYRVYRGKSHWFSGPDNHSDGEDCVKEEVREPLLLTPDTLYVKNDVRTPE